MKQALNRADLLHGHDQKRGNRRSDGFDGSIDRLIDGWIDGRIDGWIDGWITWEGGGKARIRMKEQVNLHELGLNRGAKQQIINDKEGRKGGRKTREFLVSNDFRNRPRFGLITARIRTRDLLVGGTCTCTWLTSSLFSLSFFVCFFLFLPIHVTMICLHKTFEGGEHVGFAGFAGSWLGLQLLLPFTKISLLCVDPIYIQI